MLIYVCDFFLLKSFRIANIYSEILFFDDLVDFVVKMLSYIFFIFV